MKQKRQLNIKIHRPFWETGKAFLRVRIITYAASFKRNTPKHDKTASSRLHLAQRSLYTDDSPNNRKIWQAAMQSFDTWKTLELIKKAHMDATLHKFSNKAGKLLSRFCKGPRETHQAPSKLHKKA